MLKADRYGSTSTSATIPVIGQPSRLCPFRRVSVCPCYDSLLFFLRLSRSRFGSGSKFFSQNPFGLEDLAQISTGYLPGIVPFCISLQPYAKFRVLFQFRRDRFGFFHLHNPDGMAGRRLDGHILFGWILATGNQGRSNKQN